MVNITKQETKDWVLTYIPNFVFKPMSKTDWQTVRNVIRKKQREEEIKKEKEKWKFSVINFKIGNHITNGEINGKLKLITKDGYLQLENRRGSFNPYYWRKLRSNYDKC